MNWQLLGSVAGRDGRDAEPLDLVAIAEHAASLLPTPKNGSDGKNGADADTAAIESSLLASLDKKTFTRDEVIALVATEVAKAVAGLDVAEIVDARIAKAIADIEPSPAGKDGADGKDGQSVSPAEMALLVAVEVEKAVATIPRAKDGIGVLGALVDRDGQLVVTLSDGTTKQLGTVVGRDVDMVEVGRLIAEKVALIPVLKGEPGKDGLDGTLEGLEVVQVDERTSAFVRTVDGVQIGRIRLSHPLDRGVFRDGTPYDTGDGVSFGGSFFIAQRAVTTERPEDGSGAWRLAVKRGRDGREGKLGPEGKQGLKGERGEAGRDYR